MADDDRRDPRRPTSWYGPERRRDGSISPAQRFDRIEARLAAQDREAASMSAKLDRLTGAVILMGAGMPFVLWTLDRLAPK